MPLTIVTYRWPHIYVTVRLLPVAALTTPDYPFRTRSCDLVVLVVHGAPTTPRLPDSTRVTAFGYPLPTLHHTAFDLLRLIPARFPIRSLIYRLRTARLVASAADCRCTRCVTFVAAGWRPCYVAPPRFTYGFYPRMPRLLLHISSRLQYGLPTTVVTAFPDHLLYCTPAFALYTFAFRFPICCILRLLPLFWLFARFILLPYALRIPHSR